MFVVSSSQVGAKEKHTLNAFKLMNGPRVHHFWDGDLRIGAAVQQNIESLDYPAWDFWMLFAPGTKWESDRAPEPDWWEHQLGSLTAEFPDRRLDAKRFAGKALEMSRIQGQD